MLSIRSIPVVLVLPLVVPISVAQTNKPAPYAPVGSVQELQTWQLSRMQAQNNVSARSYHAGFADDGGGDFNFQTWTIGAPKPDGNMIIAPSDHRGTCASGCMVRQFHGLGSVYGLNSRNGLATPSMFGAVCDDLPGQQNTDSTAALQAAFDFTRAQGNMLVVPCEYNAGFTLSWVPANGGGGFTFTGTGARTQGSGIRFTGNNQPIIKIGGVGNEISRMGIYYANPQSWVGTASVSGTTLTVQSTNANCKGCRLQVGMALHCIEHNCGTGGYKTYEGAKVISGSGNTFTLDTNLGTVATEAMTAGFIASQVIVADELYKSKISEINSSNGYDFFGILQANGPDGCHCNFAFDNDFRNIFLINFAHAGWFMNTGFGKGAGEDNNSWENIFIQDYPHNVHAMQAGWIFSSGEGEFRLQNVHLEWTNASSVIQAYNSRNLTVQGVHTEGVDWLADQFGGGGNGYTFQNYVAPLSFNSVTNFNVTNVGIYTSALDLQIRANGPKFGFLFLLGNSTGVVDGLYETGTKTNGILVFRTQTFSPNLSGNVDLRRFTFEASLAGITDSLGTKQYVVKYNGLPPTSIFADANPGPAVGETAIFTDSSVTATGSTIANGGAHKVEGVWNGSHWIVLTDAK